MKSFIRKSIALFMFLFLFVGIFSGSRVSVYARNNDVEWETPFLTSQDILDGSATKVFSLNSNWSTLQYYVKNGVGNLWVKEDDSGGGHRIPTPKNIANIFYTSRSSDADVLLIYLTSGDYIVYTDNNSFNSYSNGIGTHILPGDLKDSMDSYSLHDYINLKDYQSETTIDLSEGVPMTLMAYPFSMIFKSGGVWQISDRGTVSSLGSYLKAQGATVADATDDSNFDIVDLRVTVFTYGYNTTMAYARLANGSIVNFTDPYSVSEVASPYPSFFKDADWNTKGIPTFAIYNGVDQGIYALDSTDVNGYKKILGDIDYISYERKGNLFKAVKNVSGTLEYHYVLDGSEITGLPSNLNLDLDTIVFNEYYRDYNMFYNAYIRNGNTVYEVYNNKSIMHTYVENEEYKAVIYAVGDTASTLVMEKRSKGNLTVSYRANGVDLIASKTISSYMGNYSINAPYIEGYKPDVTVHNYTVSEGMNDAFTFTYSPVTSNVITNTVTNTVVEKVEVKVEVPVEKTVIKEIFTDRPVYVEIPMFKATPSEVIIRDDLLALSLQTVSFYDVQESDWFYSPIQSVASKKIVTGYEDKSFKPLQNVTEEELLAMLLRSQGFLPSGEYKYWSDAYYQRIGIDTVFGKQTHLNREQTAYFIVKLLGLDWDNTKKKDIPDAQNITPFYLDAVELLYSKGIIVGVNSKGEFSPKETLTRAQVATIIDRLND